MSAIFAWPSELTQRTSGLALTFVVPATSCNLRCKFCAISQRRELGDVALTESDYAHFVADLAMTKPLSIASIQGYEPLLDESWNYTAAILSAAQIHGIPSSLVTNGTNLRRRVHDLMLLEPAGITVSVDSAQRATHDHFRGVNGAFDRTIDGIKALVSIDGYANRVTVSSVLMPRRPELLLGMPELLASLGLTHWVVNPLLRIGRDEVGGAIGTARQVIHDIQLLEHHASKFGVSVVLDDELGELRTEGLDFNRYIIRRFDRPDGLIRLSPTGACSVGGDILREVDDRTPVWRPSHESPRDFVRRLLSPEMLSSLEFAAQPAA